MRRQRIKGLKGEREMTKMFEVGDRVVILKNKITKREYIGTKAYIVSPKDDDCVMHQFLVSFLDIPEIALKMEDDGKIQYIPERNACDIICKIQ